MVRRHAIQDEGQSAYPERVMLRNEGMMLTPRMTGQADMARHHYEIAIHVLDTISEDKILEETEGIPAQKMKDMIQMLLGG